MNKLVVDWRKTLSLTCGTGGSYWHNFPLSLLVCPIACFPINCNGKRSSNLFFFLTQGGWPFCASLMQRQSSIVCMWLTVRMECVIQGLQCKEEVSRSSLQSHHPLPSSKRHLPFSFNQSVTLDDSRSLGITFAELPTYHLQTQLDSNPLLFRF